MPCKYTAKVDNVLGIGAVYSVQISGNVAQTLKEAQRQEREGSSDAQNAADLLDAAQIFLQFHDNVLTTFDLQVEVALDDGAAEEFLRIFNVVDQVALANLRTRSCNHQRHRLIANTETI